MNNFIKNNGNAPHRDKTTADAGRRRYARLAFPLALFSPRVKVPSECCDATGTVLACGFN